MKVVHVIPVPCIFESTIRKRADAFGHACFRYGIRRSMVANLRDFWRLYTYCRRNPDDLFLFHNVPHLRILVLSLLLRRFDYGLLYWGADYYAAFLDESEFEQHCIAKSPLLRAEHYKASQPAAAHRRWRRSVRQAIGFRVLARACAILSLCPKQFRIARFFYFRVKGSPLRTPQFPTGGYAPPRAPGAPARTNAQPGELTVLICHSATPTVAHHQTLEILKEYKRRWNVRLHIRGFLSYSGGDETFRDRLAENLTSAAGFADSVSLERKFVAPAEVEAILQQVDLAVFSCLRDEGVGLLTQFVGAGGLVCFNRFSFDYDFFRHHSPSKLLTHEQLLETSPLELARRRGLATPAPPRMMGYDEFDGLLRRPSQAAPAFSR